MLVNHWNIVFEIILSWNRENSIWRTGWEQWGNITNTAVCKFRRNNVFNYPLLELSSSELFWLSVFSLSSASIKSRIYYVGLNKSEFDFVWSITAVICGLWGRGQYSLRPQLLTYIPGIEIDNEFIVVMPWKVLRWLVQAFILVKL